jgi:hypothetical protein
MSEIIYMIITWYLKQGHTMCNSCENSILTSNTGPIYRYILMFSKHLAQGQDIFMHVYRSGKLQDCNTWYTPNVHGTENNLIVLSWVHLTNQLYLLKTIIDEDL